MQGLKKIVVCDIITANHSGINHAGVQPIHQNLDNFSTKDVFSFLSVRADVSFEILRYTVFRDPGEPIVKALARKDFVMQMMKRDLPSRASTKEWPVLDMLFVCRVMGMPPPARPEVESLGNFFSALASNLGLVFVSQSSVTEKGEIDMPKVMEGKGSIFPNPATSFLLEFGRSGLFLLDKLHLSGCHFHTSSCTMTLTKKHYQVREPHAKDVEVLCNVDKDSWEKPMRCSLSVLTRLVKQKPQGIFILTRQESDAPIGAIYFQRVKDGNRMDAVPWHENSFFSEKNEEASGNVDPAGAVLQLMHVSTHHGGKGGEGFSVGSVLCDFCLQYAATLNIQDVFAITHATSYDAETMVNRGPNLSTAQNRAAQENAYAIFDKTGQEKMCTDHGLSFHLGRGARLVRKTVRNWIPEDMSDSTFGVIVKYKICPENGLVVDPNLHQMVMGGTGTPPTGAYMANANRMIDGKGNVVPTVFGVHGTDSTSIDITSNSRAQKKLEQNSSWMKHAVVTEVKEAVKQVAHVSGEIDNTLSLMDIGLDSLAVLELSTMLQSWFGIQLPSTLAHSWLSIEDLAEYIHEQQSNWTKHAVSMGVQEAIKHVINMSCEIDNTSSLMDIGLDSLTVMELSTMLQSQFEMTLPSTLVYSGSSIGDLTEYIHDHVSENYDESKGNVAKNAQLSCTQCQG